MKLTKEIKEYLDKLRDSGKVNMFGVGVYLQRKFGLTRNEARNVLIGWMTTYKD